MKLDVNAKPNGQQHPVLDGENGRMHIGPADIEPDELTPGQALVAMVACARKGWEWERVL